MSNLRIENKYLFDPKSKNKIVNQIINNKYREIYPKRLINSIYFDTRNLQCYTDSVEGVVPRKKFRIRKYNDANEYKKEIKEVTPNGKFKSNSDIFSIPSSILDRDYKILFPIVSVTYSRLYFGNEFIRITLDYGIRYNALNTKTQYRSPYLVVETKLADDIDYKQSINDFKLFNLNNESFSKYKEACEMCILNITK